MRRVTDVSFFGGLAAEIRRCNKLTMLLLSLGFFGAGVFTRAVSGSPVFLLSCIGDRLPLLPVWVFLLFFGFGYFLCGCAFGAILGDPALRGCDGKYRGGMWFCLSMSFSYVWYPIFFATGLFGVSVFVAAACGFCAVTATFLFARYSRIAVICMVLYDVWIVYLFILNIRILFVI